ncbi:helix-turn-helix domain-containing protein [Ruminococcus gauvreauii]|uniref:helix-turn-helix domain-containing protein n=1 Tax=Ruminococcus gauvreauii TaxID=438033 RepID=UPI003983ED6C
MGLQKCGLNLNRVSRELQPHGTYDFPCAGYTSLHTDKPEDAIPWHWHKEIEIIYVRDGTIKLQIPAKSFLLKKGDCIAINSNILHYAATDDCCQLHSLVFSQSLITGSNDSVFSKKYMYPLISCTSFDMCFVNSDGKQDIKDQFMTAFASLAEDMPGFEFVVREKLSRICLFLYRQFEQEITNCDIALNQDNHRIQTMLNYIHEHFAEQLTLSDISRTADIGERECLRCFRRTIQLPPMQYLLKYRIVQGAALLIQHPSASISEIAVLCGFDSPSNFAKMFRRFYSCSPREYRKKQSNESFSL